MNIHLQFYNPRKQYSIKFNEHIFSIALTRSSRACPASLSADGFTLQLKTY